MLVFKKEAPAEVFSCEFWETFKNTSGGCLRQLRVNFVSSMVLRSRFIVDYNRVTTRGLELREFLHAMSLPYA